MVGDAETAVSLKRFGFNAAASDRIPLNRSVLDTRPLACRSWDYPDKLPPVSILLVFFNEPWTLLSPHHPAHSEAPDALKAEFTIANRSFRPRADSAPAHQGISPRGRRKLQGCDSAQ